MKKLYKRDESGKIRVWWAEIAGGKYRLHSGIRDGSVVTSEWTVCEGKNLGRSNETSPESQVKLEVEAHYKKKLKRGYANALEDIDDAKAQLISPQLAHEYEDHKKNLSWPLIAQPKLDGIRCFINAQGVWSRKGERITTIPHIALILQPLAARYNIQFDGELYNHQLKDDFNKITSLVRRQKIDDKHARDIRDLIEYHIYDLIDNGKNCRLIERLDMLGELFNEHNLRKVGPIRKVHSQLCKTKEDLDDHYEVCLENGFEGQMVRDPKSQYERKRTKALLKRKEFQDEEFEIIGVVEGKGNRSGMVGALMFETSDGKPFQAALMGTNQYRVWVWKEHLEKPIAGLEATVKYFRKTPDGIPRFPVVKSIDFGK